MPLAFMVVRKLFRECLPWPLAFVHSNVKTRILSACDTEIDNQRAMIGQTRPAWNTGMKCQVIPPDLIDRKDRQGYRPSRSESRPGDIEGILKLALQGL